ncbi:MAG: hypothetical protein U0271_02655 [Polyangiaceae bacterium]
MARTATLFGITLIGLIGCFGTGCGPIHSEAMTPTPIAMAKEQFDGKVVVTVDGLDDGEYCTKTPGLREFCMTRGQTAFSNGFAGMLPRFFKGGGEGYNASFRFLDMQLVFASTQTPGRKSMVKISMKWQFELRDPSGEIVLQLAETTIGENPMVNADQSPQGIREVMEQILEQIGAALNKELAES